MPKIILIHYVLTNSEGKKLDSSEGKEPFPFLEGSHSILPALEEKLLELKVGAKSKILLSAVDAYGTRDEELVMTVPPENLPSKDVKIGDQFRASKEEDSPGFAVVHIGEKGITLDGNHPLAGQDLVFDIEVISMREATAEEQAHGHAHGAGGHHAH